MDDESDVPLSVRMWMMRCTFVSEDVDDESDVPLSVRMWVMRMMYISQ